MGSTNDMRSLMDTIVNKAKEEMNSQIAFVMLISDGNLQVAYSFGMSEITKELLVTKVGEGVLGSIAANGLPVRISEKNHDLRFQDFVGAIEKFKNILAVPLITPQDKEIIGVLAVANNLIGDSFDEKQEKYLTTLAMDAAMFIKQMSLFNDLQVAYANLEKAYIEIIIALAQAVETKDKYTHGHISRVKSYSLRLAKKLNLSATEQDIIVKAAILHDIGKIGTPDNVLLKPDKLNDEEWNEMKKHAVESANMLKNLSLLPPEVRKIVRHHHEKYDGTGYPDSLKGDEIPIGAQIISVADVFDALTTDRPYRKAFNPHAAIKIMQEGSGTQFNPEVLNAFISIFEEEMGRYELKTEKEQRNENS